MDEFTERAAQVAVKTVEENLIQAQRDYEDATRSNDEMLAGDALTRYAAAKNQYDTLTGAGQPQQQQQSGELTTAQMNFLSRRAAGGDHIDGKRMQDYAHAHERAIAAGFRPDSAEYFRCIEWHVDHQGDGKQPPLDERSAARICGVSEQEYAQQARKLRALKAEGLYRD